MHDFIHIVYIVSIIESASKVAEILWMTTVESHENISCYLVNKQKLFCTRASIHGATTPVGLADACLQDLLLGLSLSCSNLIVTSTDLTIAQKWLTTAQSSWVINAVRGD